MEDDGVATTTSDDGQDPCAALSDEAHRAWRIFSERLTKLRASRTQPNDAANLMGIKPSKLRMLIEEIVDARLIEFDQGHVRLLPEVEPCPHRDQAVGHARTGMPGHAPARSNQAIRHALSYENPSPSGSGLPPAASGDGAPENFNRARTAMSLVDYFQVQCTKSYFGKAPGTINTGALRRNISKWLRVDKVSYDTIKAMIDVFASDQNFLRKDTPAWLSFVNQRQKLLLIAEERAKRNKQKSRWTGSGKTTFQGFMPKPSND